jgi:hypothetical protein
MLHATHGNLMSCNVTHNYVVSIECLNILSCMNLVGSSSQADYLERNAAMDDSIGGS